jgi:hypothetical protein
MWSGDPKSEVTNALILSEAAELSAYAHENARLLRYFHLKKSTTADLKSRSPTAFM